VLGPLDVAMHRHRRNPQPLGRLREGLLAFGLVEDVSEQLGLLAQSTVDELRRKHLNLELSREHLDELQTLDELPEVPPGTTAQRGRLLA
jgi:hypothetical protein